MKVTDLFEGKSVTWTAPDFENEWKTEGKNHPDWFDGRDHFLTLMKTGSLVPMKRTTIRKFENHTPLAKDWKTLDGEKRARVKKLFDGGGVVEAPIVLHFMNEGNKLYLLGGNTRLNYAANNGFSPKVWLVNIK